MIEKRLINKKLYQNQLVKGAVSLPLMGIMIIEFSTEDISGCFFFFFFFFLCVCVSVCAWVQ